MLYRLPGLIQQCCQALKKVMEEFHHFRKAPELMENIITINTLEEEGDKFYMHAIRNLYKGEIRSRGDADLDGDVQSL